MSLFFFLLAAHALAAPTVGTRHITRSTSSASPAFSASQLSQITANMVSAAQKPWELGTMMEALTELNTPALSVFGASSLPATQSSGLSLPDDALAALNTVLATRAQSSDLKALISDSAAGDPASIGVTDLIAGILTGQDQYIGSAADQLDWLLHDVPLYTDQKTISHRQSEFQAWADYISMVPPFIAYSAVTTNDINLMKFAHTQVKNYRELLRDSDTGLWRHVEKGSWSDSGLWASGNGWAAHGILRVEQTISKSQFASSMQSEIDDLREWVKEILDLVWARQEDDGLVKNYLDMDNSFHDASGTTLLTAATYRYAQITGDNAYIANAERAFTSLINIVDADGWLQNVVDPDHWSKQGEHSPEAQSFLVMLHSASQAFYS